MSDHKDIIATRTYRLDGPPIEVRLYRPVEVNESYNCLVEVGDRTFTGFGGESMTALMMALTAAHDILYQLGVTRWLEGWEGLGLPPDIGARELPKNGPSAS